MSRFSGATERDTARHGRRRARRLRLILAASRTLDVILQHVRNGGGLIELCDTWQVRYSDVVKWLRDDKSKGGRNELYTEACNDRALWTDEMVLSEIRLRCRLDIRRLYHENGMRKAVHELDPEIARMVEEIRKDGTIKFFSKKDALELAAKNRKLLTDKTELEVGGSLEDILAKSYDEPDNGDQGKDGVHPPGSQES